MQLFFYFFTIRHPCVHSRGIINIAPNMRVNLGKTYTRDFSKTSNSTHSMDLQKILITVHVFFQITLETTHTVNLYT